MRLPKDCRNYGLDPSAPYGNLFNQVPTLDMANMRGVQLDGLAELRGLLRASAHAAVNLVDRGLATANRIHKDLVTEVAALVQGNSPRLREGIVETTGSHSNEKALRLAKRAMGRSKVVCSSLTHGSLIDAARDLEMPLTVIPVDPETMQMSEQTLLEAIDGDAAVLVLTAGVTHLGLVETLPASVEVKLKELGVRVHVDAAYGGLNLGLQDPDSCGKQSFDALVRSDAVSSITVDTHKFAGPMGCSILLLSHEALVQEGSYLSGASWLTGTTQGSFIPSMTLSALQGMVRDRLRTHAERNVHVAQRFAMSLYEYGLETLVPVSSGVVPIKLESFEEAVFLYEALICVGFNMPKPFRIQTSEGEVYGLRFVFTPDVTYDFLYLTDELAPMVADIVRKSREMKSAT